MDKETPTGIGPAHVQSAISPNSGGPNRAVTAMDRIHLAILRHVGLGSMTLWARRSHGTPVGQ